MEKLTDNEIIKALECCSYAKSTIDCRKCPYYTDKECVKKQCTDIIDLINRQQAEIEVLKKIQQKVLSEQGSYTTNDKIVCEDCENLWVDSLLKRKVEAIKEFMAKAKCFAYYIDYPKEHRVIDEDDLDNLVKEMVGE